VPKQLTAVSLFSGCGGFDWGAQQAGVDVLWANDIDRSAADAYQRTFPSVDFHHSDISKVDKFPEADVLIGCYPCTGFSLGSRRRAPGEEERDLREVTGNFLYQEFLRALTHVRPKYLFVENVRGMLSAEKGWFFHDQIKRFKEAGYRITFAQLDASRYGVPQSRERVFIVGVRRDVGFRYEFAAPTHASYDSITVIAAQKESWRKACLEGRVIRKGKSYSPRSDTCIWTRLATRTLSRDHWDNLGGFAPVSLKEAIMGKTWSDDEYCETPFHGHYLTRNRKRGWHEPSFTIVAHAHHVPLHPGGEPMINIGTDAFAIQGEFNRRLSWRECATIQGLPETCVPSGTLNSKYRVIGNAVPPVFGKTLLKPVVEFERSL